jgi:hypothetical protein
MFIAKITRNVAEVEVRHDGRQAGQSKYNMQKLIRLFYRIIFYYNDDLRKLVKKDPQGAPYVIERKVEFGKEVSVSNTAG